MLNFDYYSPTKIYFGRNREDEIGKIIQSYGYKKVLLHYGQSSIKKSGLYDCIVKSLNDNQINFVEQGGVSANPKIELVRQTVALCKKEQVDFILAVGGGSVIDSAKLTAVGSLAEVDPWCFSMHEETVKKALPIGVILTISAAGSELSNSCVISNPVGKLKRGFNSDLIRPLFAVMNPELTYTVSKYQTGCGIVDILMHTLERYFTDTPDTEFTSNLSEGLLKTVIESGRRAIANPFDYEARANLMIASSFSHNGLTGMGLQMFFTVHKLEHELSGMYDEVAHGAGLSVLFPAWAKYVYLHDLPRFARFARNVMNVDSILPLEEQAQEGIKCLEQYFKEIAMPTTLHELGIDNRGFSEMASKATNNGKNVVKGIIDLTPKDIIAIFELAK